MTSPIPRFLRGLLEVEAALGEAGASPSHPPSGAERFFFPFFALASYTIFVSWIFSSPSWMGLRQSKSSFSMIGSFAFSSSLESSEFDLLDTVADLDLLFLESPEMLSASSSGSLVRIEEVTSHQIVVLSFRIKQTLHVGARGLRRPVDRQKLLVRRH